MIIPQCNSSIRGCHALILPFYRGRRLPQHPNSENNKRTHVCGYTSNVAFCRDLSRFGVFGMLFLACARGQTGKQRPEVYRGRRPEWRGNCCKWLIEHLKLDRFWTVERHIFRGHFLDAGCPVSLFVTFCPFLSPGFENSVFCTKVTKAKRNAEADQKIK